MKEKTSIVFTGDIGFDKYMSEKWTDEELLSPEVLEFFHSADHVDANVEGAMIRPEEVVDKSKGIFFHVMNPDAVCFLNKIEADIWNINNNHSMDGAAEGLASTMKLAKENGARTVGAGKNLAEAATPLILDEAGGIGILSTGYYPTCVPAGEDKPGCLSWVDFETIQKTIDELKKTCRWCVLVCHGGEEFCSLPQPHVRNLYRKYLEMGVDVVVGHHPHVPQNYETFENGKMIFYSLGNFIFDTDYQRAQCNTTTGILLRLEFTPDKVSYTAFGTHIERGIEHVVAGPLPGNFTDINGEEYEKLIHLSSKCRMIAEQKRQAFLHPEKYTGITEEEVLKIYDEKPAESYVKEGQMDFRHIHMLSQNWEEKAAESTLPAVREYLLAQL